MISLQSPILSCNLFLSCSISDLRSFIMFLYSEIWIDTRRLFAETFVLIFFALLAYFNVLIVSSNYAPLGLTFAIITVLQLPPRLSYKKTKTYQNQHNLNIFSWDVFDQIKTLSLTFSILVNLESLYGTKNPFFDLSPKALMQFARAKRD